STPEGSSLRGTAIVNGSKSSVVMGYHSHEIARTTLVYHTADTRFSATGQHEGSAKLPPCGHPASLHNLTPFRTTQKHAWVPGRARPMSGAARGMAAAPMPCCSWR